MKPRDGKRKPAVKRRGGKGALTIIALLFLCSGLLRLGGETGEAIAREVEAITASSGDTQAAICEATDGIPELLDVLKQRETRVAARETAIEHRMRALSVAEEVYERNMAALVEAENALLETMARSEVAAEDDIARLTTVYENMKPKDAAALFEEMAPEFSAGFLARMRPDAAADVMAGLSPQTAYSISIILAGRNASAPTE